VGVDGWMDGETDRQTDRQTYNYLPPNFDIFQLLILRSTNVTAMRKLFIEEF
jgi:hypothetical protein